MKLRVALVVILVCLAAVVFSCRRNQPSLVDANRPPDTELWYAPADSTEHDYLVHLFWRGIDTDGLVPRYIWTITDTLVIGPLVWNPSQRVRDFRSGRLTTATDSIFSFTAFRNEGGVGIKKNRQAFHIAAIDDNGVIDPTPAAIEFVATVQRLPQIRFATCITRITGGVSNTVCGPYDPAQIDTVGMFRPFSISYNGVTTNGNIREYQFFPLTQGVVLDGANVWNPDLGDTLRVFDNVGPDALPSGRFRFAASVRDDAGAESRIDASGFTTGVVEIVVNFEPETEITDALNTYFVGGQTFVEPIDFSDSVADSVPNGSWLTLFYQGVDNPSDSSLCTDVDNECLSYQVQYTKFSEVDGGPRVIDARIGWQPNDPDDSNPFGTTDSTSMNIGPRRYEIRARAVDEYDKPDGTPPQIDVIGNLTPVLDMAGIENYDGTLVAPGDTLVWDWYNPANYNGNLQDTLDIFSVPPVVRKEFYFVIKGAGHDHPKEPDGSGVKSWLYKFVPSDDPSTTERFGRADFWSDGFTVNALNDTFRLRVSYVWNPLTDSLDAEAFASRPDYVDRGYRFTLRGRDTSNGEEFAEFMFLRDPVTNLIEKFRLNQDNVSRVGRFTGTKELDFYFTMRR